MNTVIENGILVDAKLGICEQGNLYIKGDKVVCLQAGGRIWGDKEMISENSENRKRIDASGKWVLPGLIDLHVHFREPGFEYKEDIKTGCEAAAAGGFTTVCFMPNTKPVLDEPDVIELVDKKVRAANGVNALAVGSITIGQKGEKLADIKGMSEVDTICKQVNGKGICAISEDGCSVMNSALMLESIKLGRELGLKVFSHTEDDSLGGTAIGEELIVARDIMLAAEAGAPIHLCHISTTGSLEIIRRAKAEGIKVTAETAPHYFTFDSSVCGDNGNTKMNPPLRQPKDVEAIKAALKDGTMDVIATDHAPHSREEKEQGYEKAYNGIVGLETSFAVSYTKLIKEEKVLSPVDLVACMSYKPALILGAESRGSIAPGCIADIAIVDVEAKYKIDREKFKSKGRNTPFDGMEVWGRVETTIAGGKVIYNYED